MSRLYDSPYARLLYGRQPSARDLLPQVDPAEESSTAGWLLEEGLGGLGYIGSVLDKSFGARGLRGLLGGKPEELLSIIPGSDSIWGITDQADEVTGRDLLADAGFATRRQPGEAFDWQDDLLGMAGEIALDPSTYLSLGLTGAGKAASKLGKSRPGAEVVGGLADGFGAQMRAGQRGLTASLPFIGGNPLELLSGENVLSGLSGARSVGTALPRGIDWLANQALGVTPLAATQRRLYENVGEPVGRYANRVFGGVKNAASAAGQNLGRFMRGVEDTDEFARNKNFADLFLDVENQTISPEQARFFQEARESFGDQADEYAPVMNAYARSWAKGTGGNTEDFYKNLTAGKGTAPDPDAFLQEQGKQMAPVWYSKLSEVLQQKMSGPMDADQLKKMLQNSGVKPEEMLWSKMGDLKGKLTKDQVMDHLAENAVQVQTIDLTGGGVGAGRYGAYQTPGGKNYKELLLTLPTKKLSKADEAIYAKGQNSYKDLTPAEADRFDEIAANAGGQDYVSGHWDEPNVLAHIRMNDRVGADGKKVLFVEEIQSDWHQAGRDKGYKTQADADAIAEMDRKLAELKPQSPEYIALAKEANARDFEISNRVPDAPFKNNWEQLAMKRVMRYAAENGFDRVSWLPGSEQAKRYPREDALKQAGQLAGMTGFYDKKLVNTTNDLIKKYGAKVEQAGIPQAGRAMDVEKAEALAERLSRETGELHQPSFNDNRWSVIRVSDGEAVDGFVSAGGRSDLNAHTFEVTDAMKKELSEKGSPLFQGAQGSYQVMASGERVIKAFAAADISTLAHETAHDFLQQMKAMDSSLAESAAKALGAESFERIGRDQHEQFARGFEDYLRTGAAPSEKLKGVFEKFKDWLVNIYKSIVGTPLEGKLNPELKKVFDTMLTKGDDLPQGRIGVPGQREELLRGLQAKIETADPKTLLPGMQAAAREEAVASIDKWLLPDQKEDKLNLNEWLAGKDLLNANNQRIYDLEVGAKNKGLIEGVMPGGLNLADVDSPTAQLLGAAGNLLDEGYEVSRAGENLRFNPTADVIKNQKQKWIDDILADDTHGPKSGLSYSQDLQKFMDDPLSERLQKNLFENDTLSRGAPYLTTGQMAEEAVRKATGAADPLVLPLAKAVEYKPPQGAQGYAKWAEKNLGPEELATFNGIAQRVKDDFMRFKEIEKSWGARGGSLKDSFIEYAFRQMNQFPKGDPRAKTPSFGQFSKDLKASNEAFEAREDLFRNVPGGTSTINEWSVNPQYAGEARGGLPRAEVEALLREELTGLKSPDLKSPVWKQSKELAKWLENLPEHHAKEGVRFFKADLPHLVLQREKGMNTVQAAAKTAYEAAGRYAKPMTELGEEGVSLRDVAQQLGLDGADEGGSIFAQRVLGPAGKGERLSLDDVKHLGLDKATARDLLNFNKAFTTPEVLKPVLEVWDYVSNLTKTWLTRPFPSFHTRNLVSGLYNTWRGGGSLNLGQMGRVVDFLRGGGEDLIKGVSKDELWKELVAGRIAFRPNAGIEADVLGKAGEIVEQGARRPKVSEQGIIADVGSRIRQVGRDAAESGVGGSVKAIGKTDNSLLRMMTEGGQQLEDFTRVNHYVGLRNKGYAPKAAADEVLKYQIDYAKVLTDSEKAVFRRIFPWLAFSKGTLPTILEDLVTQPGKITGTMRAVTGGRSQGEFVPQYIGEGAALPLGQNEDGSQRYLSSFGLPVEDEAFKMLGSLVKGDVGRASEQLMGMAFPLIKSPMEMMFDKQLYSGRPLSDLKPYEFLSALLPEKSARIATEIAANTPASRTLSTLNKFTDPRKSYADLAIGNLLGAKITDVDQERAYNSAITKVLGDQLLGQSGVRSRQEVYVPGANIPQLNPEDALKYALYLRAEQRLREQAAAKAKGK